MISGAASRPDVGVVVVAAGAGLRAGPGEPKQFRPIHGVPMLLRALRRSQRMMSPRHYLAEHNLGSGVWGEGFTDVGCRMSDAG